MGNFFSVRPVRNSQTTNEENWIERVRQNARAFFELRGSPALAHGGAGAFELLDGRPGQGVRKRQATSLLVHGIVIAGLLLAGRGVVVQRQDMSPGKGSTLLPPPRTFMFEKKPDDGAGKGSNHDLLPVRTGNLAPLSNVVLIRPHLPDEKPLLLPVTPSVYDADAVMPVRPTDLGLPWMKDRNNSNGNQGGNTMGTKRGDNMGSSDGDYEGESNDGRRYASGAYPVKCLYCPDPEYTDEARHTKTQGSVTLLVLVTADGRASQIKIVKGLGLGLDERAIEKVRTWRFEPARDANKKAIVQWATVEVTYRLF